MVSADPGGYSLRSALRATIGLAVSATLLLTIGGRLGQPVTTAIVGAQLAMVCGVSVTDPALASQRRTLGVALLAAAGSVALAALVADSEELAAAVFCAVVFVAVLVRGRGPRGMAAGMLAFMGYFAALFVHATPAQLPFLAGAIAIAGGVAYAMRFWVFPERAARVRASVLRLFQARMQLLLDDVARDAAAGGADARRWRRIRRATGELNEAALALEEAVGRSDIHAPPAAARAWLAELLRAEVAIDTIAECVHRLAAADSSAERRIGLTRLVRALQQWVGEGTFAAIPVPSGTGGTDGRRLRWAVAALTAARPWAALPPLDPAASRVSMSSFRPGGGGWGGVRARAGGMPNDVRLAVQATLAVALSIVLGRAISPERWYWAVLAAFVVFIRATTVGETLSRAWQRILGTVVGVAAGLGIAAVVRHGVATEIALGLGAVFAAYYLLRISYPGTVIGFTIAIAQLYEMMGRSLPGLMELRIAETLAGSLVGVAVAALVFPTRSVARVRALVAEVVRAAADAITRATTVADDPSEDPALHDAIRRVDRALANLRSAVRPLWAPNVPREPPTVTRAGRAAAALAHVVRRLAVTPIRADPARESLVPRVGEQLARACRALADALDADDAPSVARATAGAGVPAAALVDTAPFTPDAAALLADFGAALRDIAAPAGDAAA